MLKSKAHLFFLHLLKRKSLFTLSLCLSFIYSIQLYIFYLQKCVHKYAYITIITYSFNFNMFNRKHQNPLWNINAFTFLRWIFNITTMPVNWMCSTVLPVNHLVDIVKRIIRCQKEWSFLNTYCIKHAWTLHFWNIAYCNIVLMHVTTCQVKTHSQSETRCIHIDICWNKIFKLSVSRVKEIGYLTILP